jgi:hypothetical protein
MSATEYRAALEVFIADGSCATHDFIIELGFPKGFANRVVDSFESFVNA